MHSHLGFRERRPRRPYLSLSWVSRTLGVPETTLTRWVNLGLANGVVQDDGSIGFSRKSMGDLHRLARAEGFARRVPCVSCGAELGHDARGPRCSSCYRLHHT